ncbi:thioredoxin family protein [Pseudomonadota bacterium]
MCRVIVLLMGLLVATSTWTASSPDQNPWHSPPPHKPAIHLYFFWSTRCPHCQEARPFIELLPEKYPWISLHSGEVYGNKEHRRRFVELAELIGISASSVPTFIWCGQSYAGWDKDSTSGQLLLGELAGCYREVYGQDPPGTAPQTAPPEGGTILELPLLGTLDPQALSLPALTLLLGALDAFNPCAFFVLLFLLSLLVHTRSRRRMLLVGGVFILFSGLIYFLFMAAWLNLFALVGGIKFITLVAGLIAVTMALVNIKDYFWFKQGASLSISEHNRNNLLKRMRGLLSAERLPALLTGTVVLAVAANSYELLCTAGFPMVYTRILTLHELPTLGYYAYLGLYNLVYVTPLLLIMLAFVFTLGRHKLSKKGGQLLKLLSGMLMLGLGTLLILAPNLLSNLGVALSLFGGAVILTVLIYWLTSHSRRQQQ